MITFGVFCKIGDDTRKYIVCRPCGYSLGSLCLLIAPTTTLFAYAMPPAFALRLQPTVRPLPAC
jgi:hypothetical protein